MVVSRHTTVTILTTTITIVNRSTWEAVMLVMDITIPWSSIGMCDHNMCHLDIVDIIKSNLLWWWLLCGKCVNVKIEMHQVQSCMENYNNKKTVAVDDNERCVNCDKWCACWEHHELESFVINVKWEEGPFLSVWKSMIFWDFCLEISW